MKLSRFSVAASYKKEKSMNTRMINIAEIIQSSNQSDIAEIIQNVIRENPNRTIYFPDGVYVIDKPILTPAAAAKSVSLKLDDFAIIRAADGWTHNEAMIRLGGTDEENDEFACGTNFGISGGIIDCNGVATAISIDCGRQTYIREVSIKKAKIGIHIKYGTNFGSSDSDIYNINITCNGERDSIGILAEGYDNTFTNIRIGNAFIGVQLLSAGNILRNIHPLFYMYSSAGNEYDDSIGFANTNGRNNWFENCYSDQYATAFLTTHGGIHHNCYAYWYSEKQTKHIAFDSTDAFDGRICGLSIDSSYPDESHACLARGMRVSADAYFENIAIFQKKLDINSLYDKGDLINV